MNKPLQGCHILYTRAAAHWAHFQQRITQLGGSCEHLPLLEFCRLPLHEAQRLFCAQSHIWLFTSRNAVEHFFAQNPPPPARQIIAIGHATAQALSVHGCASFSAPPPYTSEALLSVFQPQGQTISIISGEGGRDLLLHSLARHNDCRKIEVYRRELPAYSRQRCPAFHHLPDVVTFASSETLMNLMQIDDQKAVKMLQCTALVAALSARVAEVAREHDFHSILIAPRADEEAQINDLIHWWQQARHD